MELNKIRVTGIFYWRSDNPTLAFKMYPMSGKHNSGSAKNKKQTVYINFSGL